MRTFVALNLPAPVKSALHDAAAPLRERGLPVRWVRSDGLHLTLSFLGDIEGAEIARIDDALRSLAAQHAPLLLRLAGFGAFPSLRRASVLWVGVDAEPALMALQRDTALALSRLGYPREQRHFRPHITLGRLRGGARPPDVERLMAGLDWSATADVGTIDLMRSHTDPDGAHYEPLLRHALGERMDS
jgi:RNA 2',3'-cyclic 3'-phosphodiesterase